MAKNKKPFKKKKKNVKMSDKAANFLFCNIIDTLLKKYEQSAEKDTMSFEEYCRLLRDLSISKVNNDSLKEGENYNDTGSY